MQGAVGYSPVHTDEGTNPSSHPPIDLTHTPPRRWPTVTPRTFLIGALVCLVLALSVIGLVRTYTHQDTTETITTIEIRNITALVPSLAECPCSPGGVIITTNADFTKVPGLGMRGPINMNNNPVLGASIVDAGLLMGTLASGPQMGISRVASQRNFTLAGNMSAGGYSIEEVYALMASYLDGILLFPDQPNVHSLGDLNNGLRITNGNLDLGGNNITNVGSLQIQSFATETIRITVTDAYQPYITRLAPQLNFTLASDMDAAGYSIVHADTVSADSFVGSITTAHQPFITRLGDLDVLIVLGETQTDSLVARVVQATVFIGQLATGPQPGITGTGPLQNVLLASNMSAGFFSIQDVLLLNATLLSGRLITTDQPLITSLGTLICLNVNGPANISGTLTATTGVFTSTLSSPLAGFTSLASTFATFSNGAINSLIASTSTLTNVQVTNNIHAKSGSFDSLQATLGNVSFLTSPVANISSLIAGTLLVSNTLTCPAITATNIQTTSLSAASVTVSTYTQVSDLRVTGNLVANNDVSVTGTTTTNDLVVVSSAQIASVLANSISSSTATITTVTSTDLYGTLRTGAQPGVHSLGSLDVVNMNGDILMDGNSVSGAQYVSATFLSGSLTQSTQLAVTRLGPQLGFTLASDMNATGYSINNAGTVSANYLNGILLSPHQPYIRTLDALDGLTMNGNLNMSGWNITGSGFVSLQALSADSVTTTILSPYQPYINQLDPNGLKYLKFATPVDGGGMYIFHLSNLSATDLYGTLHTSAQPYITSLGNLVSLTVLAWANIYSLNVTTTIQASLLLGPLATGPQWGITDVGVLNSVTTTGNAVIGGQLSVSGTSVLTIVNASTLTLTGILNGNIATFTGTVSAVSLVSSGSISGASCTIAGASTLGSLSVAGATTLNTLNAASATLSGGLNSGTGTFTGLLSGVSATFSSAVNAVTATLTGLLTGVSALFSGSVTATSGTFNGPVSTFNLSAINITAQNCNVAGTLTTGNVVGTTISSTSLTLTGSLSVAGTSTFSNSLSGTTASFSSSLSTASVTATGAVSGNTMVATSASLTGALNAATGTFSTGLNSGTGTFTGLLSGASASFSSAISAVTATLTGLFTGVSALFSGSVTATSATFNGPVSTYNLTAINITAQNFNVSGTIYASQVLGASTSFSSLALTGSLSVGGTTTLTGALSGSTASFSGALNAASATTTGAISGNTVSSTTSVSGATGSFTGTVSVNALTSTTSVAAATATLTGAFSAASSTITGQESVATLSVGSTSTAPFPYGKFLINGTSGVGDSAMQFIAAGGVNGDTYPLLQVTALAHDNIQLLFDVYTNGSASGVIMSVPTGTTAWGIVKSASSLNFKYYTSTGGAGSFRTTVVTQFTASTTGIGIGGVTPNSLLQFPSSLTRRVITLYEVTNNAHQFLGFGVISGTLVYQVADTSTDHVFYAATSSSASNELLRIKGNGNVGVNTNNPVSTFHVASSHAFGAWFTNTNFVSGSTGSGLYIQQGADTGDTYTRIQAVKTGNTVVAILALQPFGGSAIVGGTSNMITANDQFEVTSGGTTYQTISGAVAGQQALRFTDGTTQWVWYKVASNTDLRLYVTGSGGVGDSIRVLPSGFVGVGSGIGSVTLQYPLDVQGLYGIGPSSGNYVDITWNTYYVGSPTNNFVSRNGGPGTLMRMFGGTNQLSYFSFYTASDATNLAAGAATTQYERVRIANDGAHYVCSTAGCGSFPFTKTSSSSVSFTQWMYSSTMWFRAYQDSATAYLDSNSGDMYIRTLGANSIRFQSNGVNGGNFDTSGIFNVQVGTKFANSVSGYSATTLNYYEEWSGTFTSTGACAVSLTFYIVRNGRGCTCTMSPDVSCTASATSPITAAAGIIPTRFRPGTTVRQIISVQSAASVQAGLMLFTFDGTVAFYATTGAGSFGSGTTAAVNGVSFNYYTPN